MKKSLYLFLLLFPLFISAQEQATLLGHWEDPNIPGSFAYDNAYNEIWGVVVNDVEYAVIGSSNGTHIFDITNPADLVEVAFIPGAVQGANIVHRDYHDFKGYLYAVADEGVSTLQIIDISKLPDEAPVVYDSNVFFEKAHNIFIDENRCRLYAFLVRGGEDAPSISALRVYSLEDPENPELLSIFNTNIQGNSLSGTHDGFVRNDTAFINVGGNGLYVVDFSDIYNPVMLGSLTSYPDQGYNHSGWWSEDGKTYILADETHGMALKILDVSDLTNITVSAIIDSGNPSENAIAHNPIIACDKIYVGYYYDGLQVYDIADPENPVHLAQYDTYPGTTNQSYEGAWGVYPFLPSGRILVSDMQTGLYIFEGYSNNCKPEIVENCIISNTNDINSLDWTIEVSPQPVATELEISIETLSNLKDGNMIISDVSGRVYFEGKISEKNVETISVASWASGMYFLKIQSGNRIYTEKILVAR